MNKSTTISKLLEKGVKAPDFLLQAAQDKWISLNGLKGKPVVISFYPADWSPVCTDQLALYNELLPEFKKFNAEILGISVDSVWSHLAFAKDRNYHFPLLADFEPKGEVSKKYRAYKEKEGFSERALYVIDKGGIIHWSYLSDMYENPGADGILQALETLPT